MLIPQITNRHKFVKKNRLIFLHSVLHGVTWKVSELWSNTIGTLRKEEKKFCTRKNDFHIILMKLCLAQTCVASFLEAPKHQQRSQSKEKCFSEYFVNTKNFSRFMIFMCSLFQCNFSCVLWNNFLTFTVLDSKYN